MNVLLHHLIILFIYLFIVLCSLRKASAFFLYFFQQLQQKSFLEETNTTQHKSHNTYDTQIDQTFDFFLPSDTDIINCAEALGLMTMHTSRRQNCQSDILKW